NARSITRRIPSGIASLRCPSTPTLPLGVKPADSVQVSGTHLDEVDLGQLLDRGAADSVGDMRRRRPGSLGVHQQSAVRGEVVIVREHVRELLVVSQSEIEAGVGTEVIAHAAAFLYRL